MDVVPADDIFKHIFFSENDLVLIEISLQLVPKLVVQTMAQRLNEPLSKAMLTKLIVVLTHHSFSMC